MQFSIARQAALLNRKKGNMALALYYVLLDGTQWKVRHSQKDQHSVQHRDRGLEGGHHCCSISQAKTGTQAQVFVQNRDGKWRAEWTYGYDPFPARTSEGRADEKTAK